MKKMKTKPINVRIDQGLLREFRRTKIYRLNRNNLTAAVEDIMRQAVAAEAEKATTRELARTAVQASLHEAASK